MTTLGLYRQHALLAPSNVARVISATDSVGLTACFDLRYQYFVQKRGWVQPKLQQPGLERDQYDDHSLHMAVFDEDRILAYLRVLPHKPETGFMLDGDFAPLLSSHELERLPRDGAVELSRLVCLNQHLKMGGCKQPHPIELLLKLLYRESKSRGFECFYVVVEEAWLRPFTRRFGLPFRTIGKPYTFPDGTRTVAAVATLCDLEAAMKTHSAAKCEWYQSNED